MSVIKSRRALIWAVAGFLTIASLGGVGVFSPAR